MNENFEYAVLGGGCFWCFEAIFDDLKGVMDVESGYSGGSVENPSYELVCSGITGHAEVVRVQYDPTVISFKEILNIFFSIHDPTTLNRQGADVGSQYRSAIFYLDEQQKIIAEDLTADLTQERIWENPIITEVSAFEHFYPAGDYHEDYFKRNPNQGYCRAVINPKVVKFRQKYAHLLK